MIPFDGFTKQDYIELQMKNSNILFGEDSNEKNKKKKTNYDKDVIKMKKYLDFVDYLLEEIFEMAY